MEAFLSDTGTDGFPQVIDPDGSLWLQFGAEIRSSFLFQDESVLDHALKLARFEALTPGGYQTLATVLPTYESLRTDELRQVRIERGFTRSAPGSVLIAAGETVVLCTASWTGVRDDSNRRLISFSEIAAPGASSRRMISWRID